MSDESTGCADDELPDGYIEALVEHMKTWPKVADDITQLDFDSLARPEIDPFV